jgi:hypothetical protein
LVRLDVVGVLRWNDLVQRGLENRKPVLQGNLRRVEVCNLGFEFLVVSPQLLDQLSCAGNIEIPDIEPDYVSDDSNQNRKQE